MPLYVYLAAVAIGVSLPLLGWMALNSRLSTVAVRANLGTSFNRSADTVRRLRPSSTSRVMPSSYNKEIQHRIERANLGSSLTAERFVALKAVGVVAALIIGGLLGLQLAGAAAILVPLIFVGCAWLLPDLRLTGLAKEREAQIELQLPDILDQLTISIEAGLGFDAALVRLTESSDGPVTDELSRMLQDMRLGLSRDAALKALANRTESADLRTFANAMGQAGRHGLAIGSVLRAQAAEARERRKFRAEERAHKVPVKILVPLVVCILPTLFIVLIGPAAIRYTEGFGG